MIGLKQAHYLGQVEHFKNAGGLIASVTSYTDTGHAEHLHYHETLHLSLILRGGNLEKRTQKDIERLPGTVTYYNPGEPHRSTHTLGGSRHVNLEITDVFIKQYGINPTTATLNRQNLNAQFLMLQVHQELLYDKQDELALQAAVLPLLSTRSQERISSAQPQWALKTDELLHDRWNEKLTLPELAAVAGLHPVNLSTYFTRYFGCTIGEYRRKLKIEKAIPLVLQANHSLTWVAHHCDFADQSHFTRTFKQLTGLTPKDCRKSVQQ